MVTPNPDTCQVVGKKAAKEKVSCIIRYGSNKILFLKCQTVLKVSDLDVCVVKIHIDL